MNSKLWLFTTILLSSFMVGCANQLQMTYYSDPPGATLYAGDRNLGRAPLTFHYVPLNHSQFDLGVGQTSVEQAQR